MQSKINDKDITTKIVCGSRSLLIFCLLWILPAPKLWAEEVPLLPPTENTESPWQERLINDDILISEWFHSAADSLDLFLVGRRLTQRPNQSSLRLGSAIYSSEGHAPTNSTTFSTNLSLPNLEEYWHLKFSSYDEQQERRGVRRNYLRETPEQQNYGATLGLIKKLGNIRTSFEPRIELQNPLKVSHSLTFESVADLKTYIVNPKVEFYATPEKGTGVFSSLDFHVHLTKVYSLTFINEGDYTDKTHFYYTTNGVAFGQAISDMAGLSYSLMFGANNRPSYHLDNYIFAISWNHLLYQKILDYQLTPHWDFSDAMGFKGVLGISFSFGLTF